MERKITQIFQRLEAKLIAATKKITQGNKKQIDNEMNGYLREAYSELEALLTENLQKNARSQYNYMLRSIEEGVQENLPPGTLSDEDIREAIYKSLGGATITQRLARHKQNFYRDATSKLQNLLNDAISEGMSRGDSIDRMTKEIRIMLNTSRYNARRIVRTESHRMREWASNQGMEEAQRTTEMFDKEWLATMASTRTRELHRQLNGQFADEEGFFKISGFRAKYPGGFGVAKMDIHCRCTTVANFDRVLKDNPGYIDQSDLNMNEWVNKPVLQGKYNGLSSKLNGNDLLLAVSYINSLNQDFYPKSVIAKFLQLEVSKDAYLDENAIKANLRKMYIKYLKQGYSKMGIKTRFSKDTDIESMGKHYALTSHMKQKYPGLKLNELVYSSTGHGKDGLGYYQFVKGKISLNTEMTNLSHQERMDMANKARTKKDGISWLAPSDSKYAIDEYSIVHELGHAIEYSKPGLTDNIVPYMISGYTRMVPSETVAESLANGVLSSNPDRGSIKVWESMGINIKEWNDVKYTELLF